MFRRMALAMLATISTIGTVLAQDKYVYAVDLVNVRKDKVSIELQTPQVKKGTVTFSFPKAIPGSYSEKDFGRFISDFAAYNSKGQRLKVKLLNPNQFTISGEDLAKITYKVDDTWDEVHENFVFQPGGTNIEAGKNFVLNNHAFFGYLEGYKNLPFQLKITKPADLYATTHLPVARKEGVDVLEAKDYVFLADNPIFYTVPDTTSFTAGKSTINVSVFSRNNKVTSTQIAGYLKPMATALANFFGELPVDSYQFLYFFEDPAVAITKKGTGGYGALEHNYSSLYFLPEIPLESQLKSLVDEVSSHEFLHILTPLNLHSEQIQDFDFINPKMSKHLWLYEGVTEYFAHLVQLQSGIIDVNQFMKNMREKVIQAKDHWTFAMTEMSRQVLSSEWRSKYESVYNKGALLGLGLDIFIRDKTNHAKNLKSVVLELSKRYGPNKPFNDDTFIEEFIAASHPDVRDYMDRYIAGNELLPLDQLLNKLGYDFKNNKILPAYYVGGRLGLQFDPGKKQFLFVVEAENKLGIKHNDVFLSVNGEVVTERSLEQLWEKYFKYNESIPSLTVTVLRGGKEQKLEGPLTKAFREQKDYIGPVENPTEAQKGFLEKFLK